MIITISQFTFHPYWSDYRCGRHVHLELTRALWKTVVLPSYGVWRCLQHWSFRYLVLLDKTLSPAQQYEYINQSDRSRVESMQYTPPSNPLHCCDTWSTSFINTYFCSAWGICLAGLMRFRHLSHVQRNMMMIQIFINIDIDTYIRTYIHTYVRTYIHT